MSFTPNLVVGSVITLLGAVLLLDRLALLEMRTVLQYWPVVLTVFGLSIIVQSLRGGESHAESGPQGRPIVSPGFVLILIVLWLAGTNADEQRFVRAGAASDPELSLLGVMGRDDRASTSTAFRGARMTTIMGRTRLDLRQATLASGGEVTVDVLGVMGAVELFVPESWTVDIRTTAVAGGTRDRRGVIPEDDDADDDDDRRSRRDRRRAARDRDRGTMPPVALPAAPQPEVPMTSAPSPSVSADASSTPPPRVIVKGLIVAGALIIRS